MAEAAAAAAAIPASAAVANEEDRALIMSQMERFDVHGTKMLNVEMIGPMLRRCGLNPTRETLDKLRTEYVLLLHFLTPLISTDSIPSTLEWFRWNRSSKCML